MPRRSPQNRPDLAARIFMRKLLVMMLYVIDEKWFEKVVAQVLEVKFQKRDLLYVNFVFILD